MWEVWRRHGKRVSILLLTILAFALFYPRLCAFIGIDPGAKSLDAFATTFSERVKASSPLGGVQQVLLALFLLLGPLGFMVVSLLYVIWAFTFAEGEPQKVFAFPPRLFRLPVSTRFLSGWMMLAGAGVVCLFFLGWTRLVQQPPIDVFAGYSNLLVWLTLLVVAQAIVWSLDGFPVARVLLLALLVFCFGYLGGPSIEDHPLIARNQTAILLSLLGLGCITGPVGLKMIRRGDWQRLRWPVFAALFQRSTAKVEPSQKLAAFKSSTRAQLWLEWRRQGRRLCLYVLALSGAGLLTMTVVSIGNGGLSDGDTAGLVIYLAAVPLFIHFCQGIAPERTLPDFMAVRPLTDGQMAAAKLKAIAMSAPISWLITVPMIAVVPLLGDVRSAFKDQQFLLRNAELLLQLSPVLVLGLMVLTWRFVAVNLWFGASRSSWILLAPIFMPYALMAVVARLALLSRNQEFEQSLLRTLPIILGTLLALKVALAFWAFRTSLRRHQLALSAIVKYLLLWTILAVVFAGTAIVVLHSNIWAISTVLSILLLLPLARVGAATLAIASLRHC
jgi:hypothetical protein